MPSKEDLARLQAIADENNATLGPLIAQLNALQADIRRIATEIAYVPKSPREKSLLSSESNGGEIVSNGDPGKQESTFDIDEEIKNSASRLMGAQPNEADLEVRS